MPLAAYTKLGWTNGSGPAINGPDLDKMDQQIKDLTDWALALSGLPAGIALDAIGDTAPSNTLVEDGSVILRGGANARLFAYVGTKYGVGDGSTTFQLSDARGRVSVGKGTHVDVDTVGKDEGAPVGSRRVRHRHQIALNMFDPSHSHYLNHGANGGGLLLIDADFAGHEEGTNEYTAPSTTGITFSPTVGPQTGAEPVDGSAYRVTLKVVTL